MSWPYWLAGAVIVLLLWLAFRRKRVADEVRIFLLPANATAYAVQMESNGYDCFVRVFTYIGGEHGRAIEVRCYRRKERQE
ncbi:hypothetical protein ACM9XA_03610 [Xanthomonas sacchari]